MDELFLTNEWNIESFASQSLESDRFHVGGLTWYIRLQKVQDQLSFSLHLATKLSGDCRLVLFTLSLSDDQQRSRQASYVLHEFAKKKRMVMGTLAGVHPVGDNISIKLTYKLQIIDRERHYQLLSSFDSRHRQELFLEEYLLKEVECQLKSINKDGEDKLRAFIENHWPRFSSYWETLDQASRFGFSRIKLKSDVKVIVSHLLEKIELKNILVVEFLCCASEKLRRETEETSAIWIDGDENVRVNMGSFLVFLRRASEADIDGMVGTFGHVLKLAKHAIELLVFDRAISLYEHQITRGKEVKRRQDILIKECDAENAAKQGKSTRNSAKKAKGKKNKGKEKEVEDQDPSEHLEEDKEADSIEAADEKIALNREKANETREKRKALDLRLSKQLELIAKLEEENRALGAKEAGIVEMERTVVQYQTNVEEREANLEQQRLEVLQRLGGRGR